MTTKTLFLTTTPVGRALLAFWEEPPLWLGANILLAASLLPSGAALLLGYFLPALVLSFPAALVAAGMVNVAAQSLEGQATGRRGFALSEGHVAAALSAWAGLAAMAASFFIPTPALLFGLQCFVAALLLLLAPFVLCLPALFPVGLSLTWRNALVIAVHSPMVALGLPALGLILGWLVVLSRGALLLVVPALWVSLAIHTIYAVTRSFLK